jgi:hypothetical protein
MESRLLPFLLRALVFIALALPAQARDGASLGDLTMSPERVPDWYLVPEPDTSDWRVVDVTDQSQVDAVYGAGQCGAIEPGTSDTGGRRGKLRCMVDNNPGRVVLHFPAGTYGFGGGGIVDFTTDEIDIRGAGPFTVFTASGQGMYTGGDNSDECSLTHVNMMGPDPFSSQNWTSGFTRGTTTIGVSNVSAFSDYQTNPWVVLHHDGTTASVGSECPNPGCPGVTKRKHRELEEVVKIVSISTAANTITVDRPLRIDYNDYGTNPKIYRFSPRQKVGVSNLKIRYEAPYAAAAMTCMTRTVDSWIRNIQFDGFWNQAVQLKSRAARNFIAGNDAWDPVCPDCGGFTLYVYNIIYARDNLVHDNVCGSTSATRGDWHDKCIVLFLGSSGNMVTYNYANKCDRTGSSPNISHSRHIFFHGNFPYENLVEGNVAGEKCYLADYDTRYDWQGPRNTFYRNRSMDHTVQDVKPYGLRSHKDDANKPIATEPNFMLNYVPAMYQNVGGCKSLSSDAYAYSEGVCGPHDYEVGKTTPHNYYIGGSAAYEYNIGTDTRSVDQCVGPDNPYTCCTGRGTAGPDGCTFGFALHPDDVSSINHNNLDRNSGTPAIQGPWAGHDLPYSMIAEWNAPDARPSGWCQEISSWPAVGADVDVMPTSNSTKIPAQRRYDGESCTPGTWSGTLPPASPPPLPPTLLE